MNNVHLRCGTSFSANTDESILDAAIRQGLHLEYSCKTGECGVCKTQVLKGSTRPLTSEFALNGQTATAQEDILTCCRTPLTDISINSEDLSFLAPYPPKTLPCKIATIKSANGDVKIITLRFPPARKLTFKAGQYVNIIGPSGLQRSYSIANSERQDSTIELQIRHYPNGQFSDYWFNQAKEGDLLRMNGPLGSFCVRPSTKNHRKILLATGTGIAPIISILEEIHQEEQHSLAGDISVYWGAREQQDFYVDLAARFPKIKFTQVLSLNSALDKGRKRYIQDAALDESGNLEEATVYACGRLDMINDARAKFLAAGLPEKHFYSDAFVPTNPINSQ